MYTVCVCAHMRVSVSRITNIILVVGSGSVCVGVCVPLKLRTPHEFKSPSSQSNLLYIQSASFHCSLLNYPLIGHASKAADEKDNFLLLIGHFTCASCTPVCGCLSSLLLCVRVSVSACVGCNENRTLARAWQTPSQSVPLFPEKEGEGRGGLIQTLAISEGEIDWRQINKE